MISYLNGTAVIKADYTLKDIAARTLLIKDVAYDLRIIELLALENRDLIITEDNKNIEL